MPRFFFHVEDRPDDLGVELPSLAAAKSQAVRYTADLLRNAAPTFWETANLTMSVEDERGLVLFAVHVLGTDAPVIRIQGQDLPPTRTE